MRLTQTAKFHSIGTRVLLFVSSFFLADLKLPGSDSIDIYGPFTLPYKLADETECHHAPDRWAYFAETLAKNAGINFALYQHHVYVLPRSDYIHGKVCLYPFLFPIPLQISSVYLIQSK